MSCSVFLLIDTFIAYPSLTAWSYTIIYVCLALNNIFTPLFFFHLLTLYNFASKSVRNWVCDMILLLSFVYAVSSTSIQHWHHCETSSTCHGLQCFPQLELLHVHFHTVFCWVLISLCHLWVAEKMGFVTNSIEQDNDVTLNYFRGFFFLIFLW